MRSVSTGRWQKYTGLVLVLVTIVLANLGALAVNAASSTARPWPWGLERMRQNPFLWAALLTAAAAVVAGAVWWQQQSRIGARSVRRSIDKALRDARSITIAVSGSIGKIRRQLREALRGTGNPYAIEALQRIAALDGQLPEITCSIDEHWTRCRVLDVPDCRTRESTRRL
jgi:hypothetical protein